MSTAVCAEPSLPRDLQRISIAFWAQPPPSIRMQFRAGIWPLYYPNKPPYIPRAKGGGWDDGVEGSINCRSLWQAMEPVRADVVVGDLEGERSMGTRS